MVLLNGSNRQPNTVDVALTSFEAYREVPSRAIQQQPGQQNRGLQQGPGQHPLAQPSAQTTGRMANVQAGSNSRGPMIEPQVNTTNQFNGHSPTAPQQWSGPGQQFTTSPSATAQPPGFSGINQPASNVNASPGFVPQWNGPSAATNGGIVTMPQRSSQPQQWRGPSQ